MLTKASRAVQLIRHHGLATCAARLKYDLLRKYGLQKRRFPAHSWEDRPLAYWCRADVPREPEAYVSFRENVRARFFFDAHSLPKAPVDWQGGLLAEADELVKGRLRYFSRRQGPIGQVESWFCNPFTGQRCDGDRHWCDRNDVEDAQGDIKFIWEPARFGWVFLLVRAYACTRDEKYAGAFWRLFEQWRNANPPQIGPHWLCGQECSIRLMAVLFGLYGFWHSKESTAARKAATVATIAVHADRISKNIDFACLQKNNHGISEALALYTVGVLFEEFEQASEWRTRGKRLLEQEGLRQIYSDGAYVQQSMNYHRVMLNLYLWGLRLAELNDDTFSRELTERIAKAVSFLYQMQDEESGRVPNYGPNDGALILPLSTADYLDYRPALQAIYFQLHRCRLYERGPWDEALLWMLGPESLNAPVESPPRRSLECPDGGYDTLRGRQSWAMVRCHTYRDRPGQADMLHLDLWWRGENILRDTGSYLYHSPQPWRDHFRSTHAHNTVVVDDLNQMTKGTRFRWFDWTRSERRGHESGEAAGSEWWEGEHYGYRARCGVTHRRRVERDDRDAWTVTDELLGSGTHEVVLHWHLGDWPYEWNAETRILRQETPVGRVVISVQAEGCETSRAEVVRGWEDATCACGWQSLYYGEKTPIPVLRLIVSGSCPMRLVTHIDLGIGKDTRS